MGRKKQKNKNKSAQGSKAQVSKKRHSQKKHAQKKNMPQSSSQTKAQSPIVINASEKVIVTDITKTSSKRDKSIIIAPENKAVATSDFSSKLEEVIAQTEGKKQFFGGKIILLGAPATKLYKRWQGLWKRFRAALKKFALILIVLLLLAGLTIALEAYSNNRVFPRVTVAEQDFGYTEIEQAQAALLEALNRYEQSSLQFEYRGQTADISLTELKIELDKEATISRLPYFQFLENGAWDLLMAAIKGSDIKPVFKKDDRLIFNLVEEKLDLQKDRAKTARLRLNEQKTLEVEAEQEGLIIDQATLQTDILARLNGLSGDTIEIVTLREIPDVTTADLDKTMSDIQLKLENQIIIKSGDKNWKFRALDQLDHLTFRKENDQTIVSVPPTLLTNYFQEQVFNKVEKPVSHLKIYYENPESEKIIFEGKALNGEMVNKEKFITDLEMAINALEPEIELVIDIQESQIEIDPRLQELGIKELLGVGHTAFAGSPSNRRHNIAVGMATYNGLLIKPGETFSFNDNLGEVDGSTGYKLELVIKAEGTVPEYGGGLCQVSSTVFKSALFTGLPIVERSPHSYAVGYYAQIDGYGMDSTIYPGVKDLRFTNDTPAHILIQTVVDGDHAYVNIFGTPDGRQVRMENYWRGNHRGAGGTVLIPTTTLPPGAKKQIESANGGFDASWDRIITKEGEETIEKIYSVYRATSNRILVGKEPAAP